jgi:hypothetical protein
MRPNAARLWKPEGVVIGDQYRISRYIAGTDFPFTTPRVSCHVPDNRSVIFLSGCRLRGWSA